jgi:hypothetical protein
MINCEGRESATHFLSQKMVKRRRETEARETIDLDLLSVHCPRGKAS